MSHRPLTMQRSLVLALLLSVVLALAFVSTQARVQSADEAGWSQRNYRAPVQASEPEPPVVQCFTAPCPGAEDTTDIEQPSPAYRAPSFDMLESWEGQPQKQEEQQQQQDEVSAVRQQRMAQLERTRQQTAVTNDLPHLQPPHSAATDDSTAADVDADMAALADLLSSIDQQPSEAVEGGVGAVVAGGAGGVGADEVVEEVMEEVVLVVAGDRWGRTLLIEMHRQIFHADASPCAHFPTTPAAPATTPTATDVDAEQHLARILEIYSRPTDNMTDLAARPAAASADPATSTSSSVSLTQRIIIAALLLSASALLVATVLCACVIRRKRRQQRVLIEPPSVQQLGLDVPMLSSSPSMSMLAGQVVQL